MRLPRVRFTVRQMMVAVAVVAVVLTIAEGVWVHWRRGRYRQMARVYAARERSAKDHELESREQARLSWDSARSAAGRVPTLSRLAQLRYSGPIDPGIYGGEYPEPEDLSGHFESLRLFYMKEALDRRHEAASRLADAAAAAKAVGHFSRLRKKYEGAASRPWLPVEPDPPPPR
jgi:hypothetical protein